MDPSTVTWIVAATTAIISALIGAWATAKLNFRYQQKLLTQQLEFQKKSQEQTEAFIARVAEGMSNSLAAIARRSPGGVGHPDSIRNSELDQPDTRKGAR